MSFQGLMSGAECAVEVNPLSQVLKHTEGDRSLQQVCNLSYNRIPILIVTRTGLRARLAQEYGLLC